MKPFYIVVALLLFSCIQDNKEKNTEPVPPEGATEITLDTEAEKTANEVASYLRNTEKFLEAFEKLPLKKIPIVHETNFNDLIKSNGNIPIDVEAFSMPKIYENWYIEDYHYQAISGYRIQLSEDFYTAVITVIINNNTMQSMLINYSKDGIPIDSEMVGYDEKDQEWKTYNTIIQKHKITYNYHVATEENLPFKNTIITKIKPNGEMEEMGVDEIYYDLISEEYKIPFEKQIPKLNAFKILPNNPNEAVVVIPEIAEGDPEELFILNTHIAIINLKTNTITHTYFETHKTNGWVSDAIRLDEIKIDTAPYIVTENIRAFGVKLFFYGSSRANPYYSEVMSLFIKKGTTLHKIIPYFMVEKYSEEKEGPCIGTSFSEKKTLMMETKKTNGYFDIGIRNTFGETIDFEDENGECQSKETSQTKTSFLKFNGSEYIEHK